MSDHLDPERAYMLHITEAITPFIRAPRAEKNINSEASPRSLESFPEDDVLLQDSISARVLREEVGKQLNEELDETVGVSVLVLRMANTTWS